MTKRLKKSLPFTMQCPCCDYFTFKDFAAKEVCPVCFWEDDGTELKQLFAQSTRNDGKTLELARSNFREFGACGKEWLKKVCSFEERQNYKYESQVGDAKCYRLIEFLLRENIPVGHSAFPFSDWWDEDLYLHYKSADFKGMFFHGQCWFSLSLPEHARDFHEQVLQVSERAGIPLKLETTGEISEFGVKFIQYYYCIC